MPLQATTQEIETAADTLLIVWKTQKGLSAAHRDGISGTRSILLSILKERGSHATPAL